ncbi:putative yir2 protein [Plasmodium yoelii yoelii]|nr:putative yir2 protein [Plasmodium yoelii yoelii]
MRFNNLRSYLPDDLSKGTTSDINTLGNIKNYCSNRKSGGTECKTDLDKINGGCIWLFEQLFVKNKIKNINIVGYIMIWLSYMLSIKNIKEFKNLNEFYNKHIENKPYYINCDNNGTDCSKSLKEITGYANYKEIIDKKKEFLNINFEDVSKLYDAFKSLCIMYTEISVSDRNDKKYLENAKKFVEKYENLKNDSNNTKDSAYYQVLSTLSNDYNNFKKYCIRINDNCSDIPLLSDTKTTQISEPSSETSPELSFEVTSSSSITNKLIPVLSIIGVIGFLLGISYKYSLFGFRKRTPKQHLREKIKK